MKQIEEHTCIKFVETDIRQLRHLIIVTKKSYNCVFCYNLGLRCPIVNGGDVRYSYKCSKTIVRWDSISPWEGGLFFFQLFKPYFNRLSPACSMEDECHGYLGPVTMALQFTMPFCGRLSLQNRALIMHELFHVLGLGIKDGSLYLIDVFLDKTIFVNFTHYLVFCWKSVS